MVLTAGSRLDAYEIVASVGAGGMGEVLGANPRRLFFAAGDSRGQPHGTLIAADLAIDGTVRVEKSTLLLNDADAGMPELRGYDVAPDGRLLMWKRVPVAPDHATRVFVVQNWTAELRR